MSPISTLDQAIRSLERKETRWDKEVAILCAIRAAILRSPAMPRRARNSSRVGGLLLLISSLPGFAAAQTSDDFFLPEHNAVVIFAACSGVLVAPDVVLTAAHCLAPEIRAEQPEGATPTTCSGLEDQARLQKNPWEQPFLWYPTRLAKKKRDRRASVAFGNKRGQMHLLRQVVAYALPRCADLALLKLDLQVPKYVARPLPVLTTPPENPDRLLLLSALRHSGWGIADTANALKQFRQTGPTRHWGLNSCHLVTVPPSRPDGSGVIGGDSGAPLLLELSGQETVVGILWGSGRLDWPSCGAIAPPPPQRHASYTPIWRPAPPGTVATDLGVWLQAMLPSAAHLAEPE